MTTHNRILNFIDGTHREGTASLFEDINPATGEVAAEVSEASKEDVAAAVEAARAAMNGPWGRTGVEQRAALLRKVADRIDERREEFIAAEMADTGKPLGALQMMEMPRAAEQFRVFADIARSTPMESFETPLPDGGRALNVTQRTPRGVIAAICPWNLPFLLMTWKVAPALACGNAIVVKPSEETPASAALLGEVMNECGVPAGVYNVVHGFGPDSAGEFLTRHPDVDAITFTGETGTGETIMRQAAVGTRDISLELGGKNAAIVFADCDFEQAVQGETMAAFFNCGQICLGNERIYVERPIFERFVEAMARSAKGVVLGDPMDKTTRSGPLISHGHRDKVLRYVQVARDAGAEVHAGGGVPDMPERFSGGSWFSPTIWTGLPENSSPVREEIFAPCLHIAPFDHEDEAIAMANNSRYGLAGTVWTTNGARANRVASQRRSGVVWVNCWMVRDLRTAFGGMKSSGIGREGGVHSLHFYSELRNVCTRLS